MWDLDAHEPQTIDNWNAFTSSKKAKDEDKKNEEQSSGDRTPPKAKPDDYGARAGRTTVLHPLDNDSAPQGRLLSIIDVDQPTGGASAADQSRRSDDRPADAGPGPQHLVRVLRSTTAAATSPPMRPSTSACVATPRTSSRPCAPASSPDGGRCRPTDPSTVPVLSDWRDDSDGDALVLDSRRRAGGRRRRVRSLAPPPTDGSGSPDPPKEARRSRSRYSVSDGRSAPVPQTLTFDVQAKARPQEVPGHRGAGRGARRGRPGRSRSDHCSTTCPAPTRARAMPSSRWEARSRPRPAPRSGPTWRTASSPSPVTEPGTYFLDYDAAFGYAELDRETVRVDVLPAPKTPRRTGGHARHPDRLRPVGGHHRRAGQRPRSRPVACSPCSVRSPTTPTARRRRSSTVAGCGSPPARGGCRPTRSWSTTRSATVPPPGIEGEVSVSQRPVPEDNTPVTTIDRVHVRGGTLGHRPGARQRHRALGRSADPGERRRSRACPVSSRSSARAM